MAKVGALGILYAQAHILKVLAYDDRKIKDAEECAECIRDRQ